MMIELNINKLGRGKTAPSTVRDSNLELYRIIVMLLIVAHHYVVNSGLTAADGPIYAAPLSWRSLVLLIFGAWGKTGINCFVLITGYFMCKSQITAKKFAKLLFEVMFYRIAIFAVFWITGYEPFTFAGLIKVIIPVRSIGIDFVKTFLVFYLFIPFLSVLIQHLNERQHIYLMLWCGFTYVFLGTVPGFSVTMNYVSWFSVLFVIASYISLYPKRIFQKSKVWAWMTMGCIIISVLSVLACVWLGSRIGSNMAYAFVTDSNTFLAVATGVCAFMLFKNMRIGYSRFINSVATSTFGVLLIHAHSDTMRQWLWKDTLDVVGHYHSNIMPFYAIGSVLAIFIICTIIDQLRIHFLERPFFKLWDKHWKGILTKYKELESKFFSRLGIQE